MESKDVPLTTSLTKENFWNGLTEKYPDQMKQFGEWIDAYKKRVSWDLLFLNFHESPDESRIIRNPGIKFHDLPIAMQFGIFVEFTSESGWQYSFSMLDHPYPDEVPYMITSYFEDNKK